MRAALLVAAVLLSACAGPRTIRRTTTGPMPACLRDNRGECGSLKTIIVGGVEYTDLEFALADDGRVYWVGTPVAKENRP